jgi:hypothetical protein
VKSTLVESPFWSAQPEKKSFHKAEKSTIIEHRLHTSNMCVVTGEPVNTFDIQPEHVNSLDTLINDHGYSSAVPSVQIFKRHTKDGVEWGQVHMVAIASGWWMPILSLWWP